MSAWIDDNLHDEIEKSFEDNFVPEKQFEKLDDSEEYLKILENRLNKIKKNPAVLKQLKDKREELVGNLLNSSTTKITTDKDIEFDETIQTNKIISHLIPEQAQTIGEIVHLVKHDELDLQKQEVEEETKDIDEKQEIEQN